MSSYVVKARTLLKRAGLVFRPVFRSNVLDSYVMTRPSSQNAVDIFKDEWSSAFPKQYGVKTGSALLFNDPRLIWGITELGGAKESNVLELGPLEGGHTYLLEDQGAKSVTSVEANSRAFLKCLVTKEVTGLKGRFLLGDMNIFMKECNEKFDICVASGVLYHQIDPVKTLRLISEVADKVYIWTHYFDKEIIEKNDVIRKLFTFDGEKKNFDGLSVTFYERHYETALEWAGFCGGASNLANWMGKKDILKTLDHFGFNTITINFDQPDHQNGPSFALAAKKTKNE